MDRTKHLCKIQHHTFKKNRNSRKCPQYDNDFYRKFIATNFLNSEKLTDFQDEEGKGYLLSLYSNSSQI